MMDLQVTVTSECADTARRNGKPVDIAKLLSRVPSAGIVDGDACVSVHVRVEEQDHDLLLESVRGFCVVDPFSYLDLYDDRKTRWAGIGNDLL